jgi:hypothetical protein
MEMGVFSVGFTLRLFIEDSRPAEVVQLSEVKGLVRERVQLTVQLKVSL